jgi:hypothetical protein
MRKNNLTRNEKGVFVKSSQNKESLFGFWQKNLKDRCCYTAFLNEFNALKKNEDFAKRFGKYLGRKLTPGQKQFLTEEFL